MSKLPLEFIDESQKLPAELSSACIALADYAFGKGGTLTQNDSGRWVPNEKNFITIKPQFARSKDIALTLRGNPSEYEELDDLQVLKDQNGYSRCNIKNTLQIAAAFSYARRAIILYDRGVVRTQSQQKTIG